MKLQCNYYLKQVILLFCSCYIIFYCLPTQYVAYIRLELLYDAITLSYHITLSRQKVTHFNKVPPQIRQMRVFMRRM